MAVRPKLSGERSSADWLGHSLPGGDGLVRFWGRWQEARMSPENKPWGPAAGGAAGGGGGGRAGRRAALISWF